MSGSHAVSASTAKFIFPSYLSSQFPDQSRGKMSMTSITPMPCPASKTLETISQPVENNKTFGRDIATTESHIADRAEPKFGHGRQVKYKATNGQFITAKSNGRPRTNVEKLYSTYARPLVHSSQLSECLLFPQKRTFADAKVMPAKCQISDVADASACGFCAKLGPSGFGI